MGIIAENCIICSKNEDKKEKEDKNNISVKKVEPIEPILTTKQKTIESEIIVGDEKCKGTISITIDNKKGDDPKQKKKDVKKSLKSSVFLFTSIFYKDPSLSYNIIPDTFPNNPNIKKVSLKSNEKISRLMKIIDGKEILNDEMRKKCFYKDIKTIQLLDHPNINKIFEIYEFENNFYLILNYFDEKNLIDKIKGCGLEEESSVNNIMNQIFNSIIYLHDSDIYNIDLKLENILIYEIVLKTTKKFLFKKGKKSTDSEHNNKYKEKKELKKVESLKKKIEVKISVLDYLNKNYEKPNLDSLIFYPPEIIEQIEKEDIKKNDNDKENRTDEWACGILMYYLITGEFPFKGKDGKELFSNIRNVELNFPSPKFDYISKPCKDLIIKLLEKDKNKRINIKECLEHPFFKEDNMKKEEEKKLNDKIEQKEEEIDKELLNNLKLVTKPRSKFHELINGYLCFNFLDKTEEKKLSELFKYIDQDHNNIISQFDIENAFNKNNIEYTDENIKNILNVFDYDQNTLIQYQEFLRVLCDKEDLYKDENMKSVFNAIDNDNNKFINIEDIQKFVPNDEETKKKIEKEFMEPFGMKNNDKMIFDEFCEIITKNKTYEEANKFKSRFKKIQIANEKLFLEKESTSDNIE